MIVYLISSSTVLWTRDQTEHKTDIVLRFMERVENKQRNNNNNKKKLVYLVVITAMKKNKA